MRKTHLYFCSTIVLLSACSARSEAAATEPHGLGGGALDEVEPCGDPDPVEEEPNACLFGEVFSDIRTNDALLITNESWIQSADELTELEAEQIVVAVQQSSHTDVTTAAEALEEVDEQEVRRIDFYELASERWFVVYEYGAGDNSYGAFFDQEGTDVLASIHDGDLLDCSVTATSPAEEEE